MENRNMQRPTPHRPKGPMGGPMGGPHAMHGGEKAKDFTGTMKKILRYMRRNIPAILVAFILAIASVILTLNVPNILGEATDRLIIDVTKMTVYDKLTEMQDGMENLAAAVAKIPPEELQKMAADPTTTLASHFPGWDRASPGAGPIREGEI